MLPLFSSLMCIAFVTNDFNNKHASDWYYEKIKITKKRAREQTQPSVKRRDIHLISKNWVAVLRKPFNVKR